MQPPVPALFFCWTSSALAEPIWKPEDIGAPCNSPQSWPRRVEGEGWRAGPVGQTVDTHYREDLLSKVW